MFVLLREDRHEHTCVKGRVMNAKTRTPFDEVMTAQPRRGQAARSTQSITVTATPDEQLWFGIFRLGVWPTVYSGVQFPGDPEALNQYFRAMVPNTGPYDVEVNTKAVSALFNKIGRGILVTHSQSGNQGWRTAIKNQNILGIVSYDQAETSLFLKGKCQIQCHSAVVLSLCRACL